MIPVRLLVRLFDVVLLSSFTTLLSAQEADPLPRLTPRPSAIAGVSSPLISLNGIWMFCPGVSSAGADSAAYQSGGWSPISVPAEWVMQSYVVKPGTFAAYRRMFDLPADWTGRNIKLRFDGVHSVCRVWVNGVEVGEHEGGFTVFEFDVTNRLKAGRNEVTVAVKSESVADTLASASQYAAHQLGGITRKVTLFAVPELHIASLATNTRFEPRFKDADLGIEMVLLNESSRPSAPADLVFELVDPSGQIVALIPNSKTLGSLAAGEFNRHLTSLRVTDVKKWDTEHPNLYELRIHLRENGRTTETLTQRIGLRQVSSRGNKVFVNGRPIKLHGVNRHEVHPTLGRSLTPDLWRMDAELFRAANVNYVRTSHYPPAEEFLDACDELGIFVECEAALCWVQHGANEKWKEWDYRDDRFLPYLVRANLENVTANRHHPSVIIWSLANESYWSPSFARVLDAVRRADPTRLTSFHDQCWGKYNNGGSKAQVAVYHYPDEKSPERCNREERPVLFGEYTHIECYNRKEDVTDPGIRDNWGGPFERMYDLVYRNPGCLGGAIWAGVDEIFVLPDGQVCGYGPWGIIDAWRRLKPEYWHVKKSYSPVRIIEPGSPRVFRNGIVEIPLENRYNFTNLSEVGILWRMGYEKGRASAQVGPHEKGRLIIRPKHRPLAGEKLELTFTDPRGFICEREELSVFPERPFSNLRESKVPVASLDSTESRFVVRGEGYACEIDRTTGRIVHADANGKRLLVGGPELMLLPLLSQAEEAAPNYRADFLPLNVTCTGWRLKSLRAGLTMNGAAQIVSRGTYAEAEGYSMLTFHGDGEIVVEYSFRALQDVNPRQWGVVLFAPLGVDSLSWQRDGQWNTYPSDHIGRRSGSAAAHPSQRDIAILSGSPHGPWSADANELGTNDFRSTKSNVTGASLLSTEGFGISLSGGKRHSVRAFIDGQKVGLLLAGFNTGGADQFFAPHYASERKPLRAGDTVADRFIIRFIHQ